MAIHDDRVIQRNVLKRIALKRVDVVSLFPEFVSQAVKFGVVGRAVERGTLEISCWNPREYTNDVHRTVDDRPYGGGPGMVMMVEPLRRAIQAARACATGDSHTVYLSPRGKRLTQATLNAVMTSQLILVSGRYEGVDERLIASDVDEEWSIGDYVLSGGELPAMVVIDALTRLIPGVLGAQESAEQDSFMEGRLDYPHYTRPEILERQSVPGVLLSGDHERIRRWRLKQSLRDTLLRRPDLLNRTLSVEERSVLAEIEAEIDAGMDMKTDFEN